MVTLLAYRMLRLPVSTAHGRPRHVRRANGALRFPSPNNATSIMAATGIQLNIANNCTSLSKHQFSLFHFQQHHSWRLETTLKEPMGRGHILQCDLTSIYLACASFSSRLQLSQ